MYVLEPAERLLGGVDGLEALTTTITRVILRPLLTTYMYLLGGVDGLEALTTTITRVILRLLLTTYMYLLGGVDGLEALVDEALQRALELVDVGVELEVVAVEL